MRPTGQSACLCLEQVVDSTSPRCPFFLPTVMQATSYRGVKRTDDADGFEDGTEQYCTNEWLYTNLTPKQSRTTTAASNAHDPVKLFSEVSMSLGMEECASIFGGCGVRFWRTENPELVWEDYGLPPYRTVACRKGRMAPAPASQCFFRRYNHSPHHWTPDYLQGLGWLFRPIASNINSSGPRNMRPHWTSPYIDCAFASLRSAGACNRSKQPFAFAPNRIAVGTNDC